MQVQFSRRPLIIFAYLHVIPLVSLDYSEVYIDIHQKVHIKHIQICRSSTVPSLQKCSLQHTKRDYNYLKTLFEM